MYLSTPTNGTVKETVTIDINDQINLARFNKEQRSTPTFVKLLPGAGYISNGQNVQAKRTYISFALLAGSYFGLNYFYNKKSADFDFQYEQYLQTSNFQDAVYYRNASEQTLEELDLINKSITAIGVTSLAVYLFTTLRGFQKPSGGYRGKPLNRPSFSVIPRHFNNQLSLSLNLKFSLD